MPRKKPSKKRMSKRLDIVVRDFVKLRDHNICQICGIHKESTPEGTMDWSHYISRNYLIVRWDQRNSCCSCRKCHRQYAQGFNSPMMDAINKMWGSGTTIELEKIAADNTCIKNTYLNVVDYRLDLESYYKKLIDCLNADFTFNQINEHYMWNPWYDDDYHLKYKEQDELSKDS